jgi:hypothetical protein
MTKKQSATAIEKILSWGDLGALYKERTGNSAFKYRMETIYKWATKQEDIKETKNGLILIKS